MRGQPCISTQDWQSMHTLIVGRVSVWIHQSQCISLKGSPMLPHAHLQQANCQRDKAQQHVPIHPFSFGGWYT